MSSGSHNEQVCLIWRGSKTEKHHLTGGSTKLFSAEINYFSGSEDVVLLCCMVGKERCRYGSLSCFVIVFMMLHNFCAYGSYQVVC